MQGVRDYIKYLKRGYSRVTQMTSLDLRNGRITKEEAEELIRNFEGRRPQSLKLFLEFLEMDEQEFNDIVKKTVVSPHEPDFNLPWGQKTWDFDQWYRSRRRKWSRHTARPAGRVAKMIGVLNHDMGNLRSVTNAIYSLGYDYLTVTEPAQFDDLSHLVILRGLLLHGNPEGEAIGAAAGNRGLCRKRSPPIGHLSGDADSVDVGRRRVLLRGAGSYSRTCEEVAGCAGICHSSCRLEWCELHVGSSGPAGVRRARTFTSCTPIISIATTAQMYTARRNMAKNLCRSSARKM